jgi:hypothetical protein
MEQLPNRGRAERMAIGQEANQNQTRETAVMAETAAALLDAATLIEDRADGVRDVSATVRPNELAMRLNHLERAGDPFQVVPKLRDLTAV